MAMTQSPRDVATKHANYGKLALEYARRHDLGGEGQAPLPTIRPGTKQWVAWEQYFLQHLEFNNLTMVRVRKGMQQEMTVPSEWPWEFDASCPTSFADVVTPDDERSQPQPKVNLDPQAALVGHDPRRGR